MRWLVADVLTGRIVGQLPVTRWNFTDPGTGSGTANLTVNVKEADTSFLKSICVPDAFTLIADSEDGKYPWSGILENRAWKRKQGNIVLAAQSMNDWFYSTVLRPGAPYVNVLGDYIVTGKEQADIMADIAQMALASVGVPPIQVVRSPATGVLRDVTMRRWKNLGEAMDSVSRRDRGMEWWVDTAPAPDERFVQWTWRSAFPERSSRKVPVFLWSSSKGGNILDYDWPESSAERRARVTALGEGSPPDQAYAWDEDPNLAAGGVLLREQVSGPYSGITNPTTLFNHARAERLIRNDPISSVTLKTLITGPSISEYITGDRARISIHDDWLDEEVPAARIISRTISGGRGVEEVATLVVDLNDAEMPDTGEGTEV